MHTPDGLEKSRSAVPDALSGREEEESVVEEEQGESASTTRTRWHWRPALSGFAARFQRAGQIHEAPTERIRAVNPTTPPSFVRFFSTLPLKIRSRRRGRRERVEDWQNWSKFHLWRRTRPLWGSLLLMSAGLIMLISASYFLPLAFLAQSLWPAFLVGGLLLVMGLIQLFLPSYAVITGSIGMVLALVSLLVASFGGCGLGLLLGVIGSALSIAWRPVKRARIVAASTVQER